MDLREVIEKVKIAAESAHSSFHAGRRDDAERYLYKVGNLVVGCLPVPATPAGDVTESATSEKPAEEHAEKPAEVPGAPAQPAEVGPVLPASQFGVSQKDEKPTQ